MAHQDFIIQQTEHIKEELIVELDSLGIGGSHGNHEADEYSDIDFFLVFSDSNFFNILGKFPKLIKHPFPILFNSGPDYTSGFGFCYYYIFENGLQVDYYLNCNSTMDINPMRMNTDVLFDKTGFYSEIIKLSKEKFHNNDYHISLDTILFEYVSRLLKIRKSILRKNWSSQYYYLDKLRHIMIGIDKSILLNIPYNSFHSDQKLSKKLGENYESFVLTTFPKNQNSTYSFCFDLICNHIEKGLFKLTSSINEEQLNYIRKIKTEILNLL